MEANEATQTHCYNPVNIWCYTILELHARNDDDDMGGG